MPGGLLNLISEGNLNKILNGNPTKTFFKAKYSKFSNFGLQKFRINFEGLRNLRLSEDSIFEFTFPRYADLLMDTYLVVALPNIWSPIIEFSEGNNNLLNDLPRNVYDIGVPLDFRSVPEEILDPNLKSKLIKENLSDNITRKFYPYEFKWIENLGVQMIRHIRFYVAGGLIQEFSGQYLYNLVQRDFTNTKKELFERMIGNTPDLMDPANFGGRNNVYPNVVYNSKWQFGPEPSIRGKLIYIPINIWFTLLSETAFPLISLQYQELRMEVSLRPIQELFIVRYIPTVDQANNYNTLLTLSRNMDNKNLKNKFPDFIEKLSNEEKEQIKNLILYLINDTQDIGKYVQPNQIIDKYRFFRFINLLDRVERIQNIDNTLSDSQKNLINRQLAKINEQNAIRNSNGTLSPFQDDNQFQLYENLWNSDIHLMSTFAFLSEEERVRFAKNDQNYLVTEVHETTFFNQTGTNQVNVESLGLVRSWMWFFQRSDVNLRNQWSNYTNWDTRELPFKGINDLLFRFRDIYKDIEITSNIFDLVTANFSGSASPASFDTFGLINLMLKITTENKIIFDPTPNSSSSNVILEPEFKLENLPQPYLFTGIARQENQKNIMINWGLLMGGRDREFIFDAGINNYIEKYMRTPGNGKNGLYCYNFCLNTDPFTYQPSGAINTSKFTNIIFQFETIFPTLKEDVLQTLILNPRTNQPIGINKPVWRLYNYNYNLHVMEERFNILSFQSGMAGLKLTR